MSFYCFYFLDIYLAIYGGSTVYFADKMALQVRFSNSQFDIFGTDRRQRMLIMLVEDELILERFTFPFINHLCVLIYIYYTLKYAGTAMAKLTMKKSRSL